MGDLTQVFNLLKGAISFIGAGITVFGAIEIFQSFVEQNPQAKSLGIKLLAGGIITISASQVLVNWLVSYIPK